MIANTRPALQQGRRFSHLKGHCKGWSKLTGKGLATRRFTALCFLLKAYSMVLHARESWNVTALGAVILGLSKVMLLAVTVY